MRPPQERGGLNIEGMTGTPDRRSVVIGFRRAFVTDEASDEILVLSDDGSVPVDGTECKRLEDPARKRFRGLRVRLPPVTAPGAAPAAAPGSP